VSTAQSEQIVIERPVETLSDKEVLALTDLQLAPEEQSRLSDLLERNREGDLDAEGERQLDELMRGYEKGLLRKAEALRIAVQRGLREPLQP
jgi:hypothetical protein